MNHYILPIVLACEKIQKLINVIKSFTINQTANQTCKKKSKYNLIWLFKKKIVLLNSKKNKNLQYNFLSCFDDILAHYLNQVAYYFYVWE